MTREIASFFPRVETGNFDRYGFKAVQNATCNGRLAVGNTHDVNTCSDAGSSHGGARTRVIPLWRPCGASHECTQRQMRKKRMPDRVVHAHGLAMCIRCTLGGARVRKTRQQSAGRKREQPVLAGARSAWRASTEIESQPPTTRPVTLPAFLTATSRLLVALSCLLVAPCSTPTNFQSKQYARVFRTGPNALGTRLIEL